MHLGQMAKRCPESRYIGTAKLHDYRFQINQRGYANVLPSPGACVEGLVYLLNLTDEKRLDQNEGVPTAYQKYNLTIEAFTAAIEYVGRAVPELAQRLEGSEPHTVPLELPRSRRTFAVTCATIRMLGLTSKSTPRRLEKSSPKGQATEALVYLSEDFVQDSEPRDEYIDRMNAAIVDARKLGMSDEYIDTCLRQYIKDRELPDQRIQLCSATHSRKSFFWNLKVC